jgi:hypothetical protein
MSTTTTDMGLILWDGPDDHFNFTELVQNFQALNDHDHTTGKGVPVEAGGLASGAVTSAAIATHAVISGKIADGAITAAKLASDADETIRSTVEDLKVIRGTVNTAGSGTIVLGTGFTITRNGTGDVTVTFASPFAAAPSVALGTNSDQVRHSATPTTTTIRPVIRTLSGGAFVAADGIFNFIAAGPR